MEILLLPVDQENWEDVLELEVHEEQKNFVASNLYSLAEAYIFTNHVPLAIYNGKDLVGFLMHTYLDDRQEYWIFRLMIGAKYQGNGYGRAAMQQIIERIRGFPGADRLMISFEPENTNAENLYRNLGFVDTGELIDEEVVYRLDFKK
jgi:diamine N-acetyltransferase